MDGVQRNFSMMAEKIDRMRCLREKCDNYVRLIKLTLDETIQEQNALLDGSAIHNKLQYLGLIDKPTLSSNTLNIDKTYLKNIDFDRKYKPQDDVRYMYDNHLEIRQHKKNNHLIANDIYLPKRYNNYNSNYKPRICELSSKIYNTHNDSYYMPLNLKKYGKTMNFQTSYPREYQVHYFPTSKPLPQYPLQTTERFYKRKPVKQYPEEEVTFWHPRYQKPVKVIEREPSYMNVDYGYRSGNDYHVGSNNIEPYTPEYRAKYYPKNYTIYNGYNDDNYYFEPDLEHRSFSSITRPCSPVYTRNTLYDKSYFKNPDSLVEKKIRDYMWKPYKEHVERNSFSNHYDKNTYFRNVESSNNRYQDDEIFRKNPSLGLSQIHRKKVVNETIENPYKKNSIAMLSENDESFHIRKDNDNILKYASNEKKTETPVNVSKQISFDFSNDDILPDHTNYVREYTNENFVSNERKGRRESNIQTNDKRRTSLLSNDSSASTKKQRALSNSTNGHFRNESVSKEEKLASNGNSFESEKYLNLKNNGQENDLNSLKNNKFNYNDEIDVDYDHNNDLQNMSNENKHSDVTRDVIRDNNNDVKRKLSKTTNKSNFDYQSHTEIIPNKKDNSHFIKRKESCKDESKYKIDNFSNSNKLSNNVNSQLEKEYNIQNDLNESSRTIINPSTIDHNNDNEQKFDYPEQYINNDNAENNNNFEINQRNQFDAPNKETNIYSNEQDNIDITINPNDKKTSLDSSSDEYTNKTNNFQVNLNENPTHECETQPEYLAEHSENHDNYYTDQHIDSGKEITTSNHDEPIQHNEFIDENNMQNDYYYQNPTDNTKENITENQYENSGPQDNYVDKENAKEYYYQNYSDVDSSKEQIEDQYNESSLKREYMDEHNNLDNNYYYQDHDNMDEVKEQKGDQQYVDSNYQQHDDYYYQNYSDVDPKVQPPESQYTEPNHQEEYIAENNNEHDDYYYQTDQKETTNENQVDQNYIESEHQGNYVSGEQDNYYYEDNVNTNNPSRQYDENTQQESYVEDQHTNDDYYYQKTDENYDASIPKEQYDGYVGDQHETNNSYYQDDYTNNYEQQNMNYENDNYQTQQSEYIQPYEQNPNDENYEYSDKIDENQSTNEISSNEQSK